MQRDDVTTADELDSMSPAERHADFESRVVNDLRDLPSDRVNEIRATHVARLQERGILTER